MLQPEDSSCMVCDNIALWSKKSQGKIRKIVWTWLGETPSEVIPSKRNTQLHIANQPVHARDSVPCASKIYQQTCVKHDTCCIFLGYEYYKELRKQALKAVLIPHTTLYLDVSPETCNERILGRGRVQYHNWLIAVIRKHLHQDNLAWLELKLTNPTTTARKWNNPGASEFCWFSFTKPMNFISHCRAWDKL